MSDEAHGFKCGTCGEVHEGLPADFGFQMPDDVWALLEHERQSRTKITSDLCRLDERFFIRCVLFVPLTELPGESFGWGIWVEVSADSFRSYTESYETDLSDAPAFAGALANAIAGHDDAGGARVLVQPRDAKSRPALTFPSDAAHSLALAQKIGMNAQQHHDAVM